ncbi:hypothetical protein EYC98_06150 [Halieaceae bacterium IMCC14734]|uniref:FAD-binding PCMH-type domain-containing protein n=1 Tax=Candidatus Litorirhabdus singularis TaxID=2518993 RepID=A0ABT3TDW7_9GAMM|nr:FAD binding domain-containing protein [Candidatus Litorirhabdus singularis]MCX2980454.1 hypothetical protein [Candidatus Litorirhabdus singularis]
MSLYPSYARPRSLQQAVDLLSGLQGGVVVIAGGQEILPSVNYGVLMPDVYVDIGGIEELIGISSVGDELVMGALTVHRDIQGHADVQRLAPLLAQSVSAMGGGWQVHNRGTIGGNIVAMHPLYDIAPSLLALQADIELIDAAGTRRLSFADLLADSSHGLGTKAILTRVFVTASPQSSWGYYKLKNTSGAYGSANAAAVLETEGEILTAIRVVIGAAADQLTLVSDALAGLTGAAYDAAAGAEIERICAQAIGTPLSDHQGDGTWRRAMAGVVARRAVEAALLPATGPDS